MGAEEKVIEWKGLKSVDEEEVKLQVITQGIDWIFLAGHCWKPAICQPESSKGTV